MSRCRTSGISVVRSRLACPWQGVFQPPNGSNAPTTTKPGSSRSTRNREAFLRVLAGCPEELVELRATLLQEHVWPKREARRGGGLLSLPGARATRG
jgi:hypothetical protein